MEPPRITALGGDFWVTSADDSWLLVADCFGATFHRTSIGDIGSMKFSTKMPEGISSTDLAISRKEEFIDTKDLGRLTSVAVNNHTLALTAQLSHAVHLVPLT